MPDISHPPVDRLALVEYVDQATNEIEDLWQRIEGLEKHLEQDLINRDLLAGDADTLLADLKMAVSPSERNLCRNELRKTQTELGKASKRASLTEQRYLIVITTLDDLEATLAELQRRLNEMPCGLRARREASRHRRSAKQAPGAGLLAPLAV